AAGPSGGPLATSITQDARLQPEPVAATTLNGLAGADFGHPAVWVVAFLLIIMPLIANGFFLIEIFGTTLILGIVALSLMFLAGYGGMVSLMQLTIAGLAGYMTAVLGASGNANISLGWPWWLATPMAIALATLFGTVGGALAVRTEGIYTIMITLAIASAFYYFTNQNWDIFNGHTGINSIVTPHFWGVDWRGGPTDVTLAVRPGERRAVLGSNGAGKTTLFNCITGDFPPTSGTIRFFGEDVTHFPPFERIRRGLRRTYEFSGLFPGLTVHDNFSLACCGFSRSRFSPFRPRANDALMQSADDLVQAVHLTAVKERRVAELAYGQQRQLEIALALAGAPRFILFDEPAAG